MSIMKFSVSATTASSLTISWGAEAISEGVTMLHFERKRTDQSDWLYAGLTPMNSGSWVSGGLDIETSYVHRISTLHSDGTRTVNSELHASTTLQQQDQPYGRILEDTGPRQGEGCFILLKDGELVYYYGSFTGTGDKDRARIARKLSLDDGDNWQQQELVIDQPDWHCFHPGIVRMGDGRLLLTYSKMIPGSWTAYKVYRISGDEGTTWSEESRLSEEQFTYNTGAHDRTYRLNNNRIIVLIHATNSRTHPLVTDVYVSDDYAATWTNKTPGHLEVTEKIHEDEYGHGFWEATMAELSNGQLLMMGRTASGWLYESRSYDYGETWSKPQNSNIRYGQTPALVKEIPGLTNGVVLLYSPRYDEERWPWGQRTLLASMISKDGGHSWTGYKEVEVALPSHWVQYPSLLFSGSDAHIAYHRTINEDKNGKVSCTKIDIAYQHLHTEWFLS